MIMSQCIYYSTDTDWLMNINIADSEIHFVGSEIHTLEHVISEYELHTVVSIL